MQRETLISISLIIILTSCATPPTRPTPDSVPAGNAGPNMPNPASAYCEQQGYRLEIRTAADGSQAGFCIFSDGRECDEWAFFRGECGPSVAPAAPNFVQAPLRMHATGVPIPVAVLVNTGDQRGITVYDRSGLVLGEWQTSPRTGKVHVAGFIPDGVMSIPLVFWSFDAEKPGLLLSFNLGGNITPLLELADSSAVQFTEMIGVPTSPVIAYSTLQYEENGAMIRSKIYLAEYQSLASASPILVMDSRESKYITPLAIRMEDLKPAGIWFTYHMFGIGGTPALFTNNSGLYYFDTSTNTIYEFLSADKTTNNLAVNQAYVTWVQSNSGDMQVSDLVYGQTVSFPKLPESERSAGYGMVSPSGGYIAWEEGINLIPGEKAPKFTVRVGTMDGVILAEYPHVTFAKTSELGMDTYINLLGWLSDETLLVGVDQHGKEGQEVIVAVNINANEVTLFARGEFVGFGYP